MKPLKTFKAGLSRFANDEPWQRFVNLNQRSRSQTRGPVIVVVGAVVGVILMAAGLALGFVPGVPGIVFGLLGAGVIAALSHPAARWFDRCEVWLRNKFHRLRGR